MVDLHTDQAAGLRRLFPRRTARVIAFVGTSSASARLVGGCAQALCGEGAKVLILDEQRGDHGALAGLGLATRYDLAQALQGDVRLEAALVFKGPKLHAIAAARAARGEGIGAAAEREIWQHCIRDYDWILINAAAEPSRFVATASACVLAVEATSASLTSAYGRLKRIHAVAANATPYLVIEADRANGSRVVQDNLVQAARDHLGIEVTCLGALAPGGGNRGAAWARTHAQIVQALSGTAKTRVTAAQDETQDAPQRRVSRGISAPSSWHASNDSLHPATAGSL